MGGGGTIAEGIRRLFQRRAPSSSTKHNDNDERVFVRDLRSQLAIIPTTNDHVHDHDHDHNQPSLLNHIKVPTQILSIPSSMDPHKKVILLFSNYCSSIQF